MSGELSGKMFKGECMVKSPSINLERWESFESYEFPDPLNDAKFDSVEKFIKNNKQKCVIVWETLEFQRMYFLRGFSNLMVDLFKKPKSLKLLMNRIRDYNIARIKRWIEVDVAKRMKVLILIVLLLAASTSAFVIYNNYIHHHWESLNFAGMERRYLLNIPPGYDGTKPVPLVIVLHGYTESPTMVDSESDFSKKSDAEGFIVVYPEGYGSPNEGSWNVQFGFGPAFSQNIDDVGFIRALMDSLQGKFTINGNRIYVAGFSNGAIMAYRLAAELSDRIVAVAPVEGTIGGRANTDSPLIMIREPAQPVSIIVFQGTADNPLYSGGSFLLVSPSVFHFNVRVIGKCIRVLLGQG